MPCSVKSPIHRRAARKTLTLGLFLLLGWGLAGKVAAEPQVELMPTGLEPRQLAIVVNDDDDMSVRIGEYYRERRGIPPENVIHVRFPATSVNLPRDRFSQVKAEVDRQTPEFVQAYALAWTKPYRVDCMSITSAMAMGFDPAYCSAKTCGLTRPSGYYNSASSTPRADHKLRPAMLLAGQTDPEVRRMIDRGVASDRSYPTGTGYLLKTSDRARSVRSVVFNEAVRVLGGGFHLEQLDTDYIKGKKDVLFYFTGLVQVPELRSLGFAPGAMADHLTSTGGMLSDSRQMSALRFLEAGATGSYGTVVEPCNLLAKFPNPGVAMLRYGSGDTLIEAYWKSVETPGEGVFIGEPLARPFAPQLQRIDGQHWRLKMFTPIAKAVRLEQADSGIGPYRVAGVYPVTPGLNDVGISLPSDQGYFRVVIQQ
ncbi:MAG: TIGR03790 family protein [Methylococcaceae bacterium]|nr:TIGR03790 family protein [Methylococcaceae bacterium]